MKMIGLTGSIGMGKSVAARLLRRMGVPVFDSDAAAAALLSPSGAAVARVLAMFPGCGKGGHVDRGKLGQIVFAKPEERKRLEEILHPLIRHAQGEFLKKARRMGKKAAVLDIPLLFETGQRHRFSDVICVSAPFLVQRGRVLSRPAMTAERFYAVLALQWPDVVKRRLADHVVKTGIGFGHSFRQLRSCLERIRKSEGNGRAKTCVR